MAAANPQPLQARPYGDHVAVRGPIPLDDDDEGEYEDGGGGGDDAMDDLEDAHVNSVSVAEYGVGVGVVGGGGGGGGGCGGGVGGGVVMASRTSELTLSFEGEVYVFPAVTPEKVHMSIYISFSI